MIHAKLTNIPPANRRKRRPIGRRASQPTTSLPVWRIVEPITNMLGNLSQALADRVAWLDRQIKTAANDDERRFWQRVRRQQTGENIGESR